MNNKALENKEEIKLIYSSQGPNNNNELNYYIHLIVVSQKTVNVLTTINNGFTMDDKDKVYNFFSQYDVSYKLVQMDREKIKDIKHIDDINKIKIKKIDQVARDPNFDDIADNNYPTIIGTIGTYTSNNK